MPPSLHPDTGAEYFWVQAPSVADLMVIPDAVLAYWLEQANPAPSVITQTHTPITSNQLTELAADLKQLYPTLDGFGLWANVTWAFCNELGRSDGVAVMKHYWPEQEPGEYQNLTCGKPPEGKRFTVGTIKWLIKQRRAQISDPLAGLR